MSRIRELMLQEAVERLEAKLDLLLAHFDLAQAEPEPEPEPEAPATPKK